MENNPSAGSGHGGNFFSGLVLGALIGAAIIFLLGTEKGKRISKVISEKGLDNISNLLEKAEKATDLDEVFEEEEPEIVPERKVIVKKVTEENPRPRRFFRGISRHVN